MLMITLAIYLKPWKICYFQSNLLLLFHSFCELPPNPQLFFFFGSDAVVLSFFLRDQLASATSYSQVKQTLITQPLIAQVYLILSGVEAGEGSVITRDRDGAVDVWNLDAPEEWFLLETNILFFLFQFHCGIVFFLNR